MLKENEQKFLQQNELVLEKARRLCAAKGSPDSTTVLVDYMSEVSTLFTAALSAFTKTIKLNIPKAEFVGEYLEKVRSEVMKDSRMN